MSNEIEVVTSWEEFREKWTGGAMRQNFLIKGAMFPFQFQAPPLDEVLEALRRNEKTRVLQPKVDDSIAAHPESAGGAYGAFPEFRDLPHDEMMRASVQPGVTVAHFDARDFAGPGQVFDGLNNVFDLWYESLAQHGFTWNEAAAQRAFFYSAPNGGSPYHFDSSYVLACQVVGRKRFCWLKDPDRWCNRDMKSERADHYHLMERPEGITPDDVVECVMEPGDVLWNIMLTPHWVDSLDEPTYSFNLTHFDFACDGEVSPIEGVLREIRSERARHRELEVVA